MTIEEAIKVLKEGGLTLKECEEAFDMAINALQAIDDIKAEIANLDDADYDYEGYYKAITDAVKIIDKYRGE